MFNNWFCIQSRGKCDRASRTRKYNFLNWFLLMRCSESFVCVHCFQFWHCYHDTHTHTYIQESPTKWNFLHVSVIGAQAIQQAQFNFILSLSFDQIRSDLIISHNCYVCVLLLHISGIFKCIEIENWITLYRLIAFWNGNNLLEVAFRFVLINDDQTTNEHLTGYDCYRRIYKVLREKKMVQYFDNEWTC